jgi:hypothetical protein
VTALSLGGLRRRIEARMLPDSVNVRLMLDASAERERNRRRARAPASAERRRARDDSRPEARRAG